MAEDETGLWRVSVAAVFFFFFFLVPTLHAHGMTDNIILHCFLKDDTAVLALKIRCK